MNIPRTIKGIRSDLGLTQEEMSKMLKVKLETYKRYERYETRIPVKFIADLMELANIEKLKDIKFN